MDRLDTTEFNKWMDKAKVNAEDIIKCRKMQSMSITETPGTFGITAITVSGFLNNDYLQMGADIKQRYDEEITAFYARTHEILVVCAALMDGVNEVLRDEGAWGEGYFAKKIEEWYAGKK